MTDHTKITHTMSHETLSQADFDARRADGELSLTLVGMSNVGKSFWSHRLAAQTGFERVCVDDLIEEKLSTHLAREGYTGGIEDVAKWMGQPHEPQSERHQQEYLEIEEQMMRDTIARLAAPPLEGNVVIDTTGSVVHTDQSLHTDIRRYSTVVYLAATEDMQQKMLSRYIRCPKPVIWQDAYQPRSDEDPDKALARCYPDLLARRSRLYSSMAHVAIPHDVACSLENAADFLDYVKSGLPTRYAHSECYKTTK